MTEELSEDKIYTKLGRITGNTITLGIIGTLGYFIGNNLIESDSEKYLNQIATENHVTYDMPNGNKGFIFEDQDIILYDAKKEEFTVSTVEEEITKYQNKSPELTEKIRIYKEANRKFSSNFETKIDSLYNTINQR